MVDICLSVKGGVISIVLHFEGNEKSMAVPKGYMCTHSQSQEAQPRMPLSVRRINVWVPFQLKQGFIDFFITFIPRLITAGRVSQPMARQYFWYSLCHAFCR